MRVRVPKPKRTFLEMDELAALLDAAASQDGPLRYPRAPEGLSGTAASVASLAASGLRPMQIASELGLAKSTVHFQLKHLGLEVPKGYVDHMTIRLGLSGA